MESLLSPMVQVVLDKVCTAMSNKAQVITKFGGEFKKMETGLKEMKNLLAHMMNLQSTSDLVEGALSQLREVIDEADNVLTDCLVRDIYKKNKSCLVSRLAPDVVFLTRVGKQLVDINKKIGEARNILNDHMKTVMSTAPDGTNHGSDDMNHSESNREFMSRCYNPPKIYGFDKDIKQLKEWMFDSTKVGKLNFAGIVGMGGLGKTTIARQVFIEVTSYFEKVIWVPVTQSFSAQRVVNCMLTKIDMEAPNVSKSASTGCQLLFNMLQQGLDGQSYLIVMDDVWDKSNLFSFWDELRNILPTKVGKRSCIIITTRSYDVASRMVDRVSPIIMLPTLNKEDSWSLFSSFAFRSTEGECPDKLLENEGQVIVERCGGLPLAIKTIGGYLASIRRPGEWTKISLKFHKLTINGQTEPVMVCLKLSYDELPTYLKHCLLCLHVYPEDFEIHAGQLIHWWLGDDLIQGKDDDSKTAVELGYEHLEKLANRCLLEVVKQRDFDGRIHKFKIHDMVRELITEIAAKEKFCCFNQDGMQIRIEDSRWLYLAEDMAAKVNKSWIKPNSKMRALLLMSSPPLIDLSMNFIVSLESLRVLDLSYSKLHVISVENSSTPSSGICGKKLFKLITSLKRLACLNLSGMQNLSEVTSNIKKLLNLQVFVLKGCENLVKIHAKISSLKRLVVLDLGTCPLLQDVPWELGSLYCLQELYGFRVLSRAKTRGCTLLELGKLEQLRVLQITICDLAEISDKEKKSLSSLQSLKVLALDAKTCEGENLKMIDELKLPPKIEELHLSNYHSPKMPKWFSPSGLEKLKFLSIENCDFESLQEKSFIWCKIEGLNLKLSERLRVDWNDLKRAMPALCCMEINTCSSLIDFPIKDVFKGGVWKKEVVDQ